MRTWVTIAAAAFQVLVLAYMGLEREYLVRTGRTVYLRTAPIDPRDLFRGDFVRLEYEASTVASRLLRDGLREDKEERRGRKGTRVYAALNVGENNLADVHYATDKRPEEGVFIRGRIRRPVRAAVRIRYGIEAYFVEQGKGVELERRRSREGIQVPLEMEVAVGRNGLAVLKGHRWSRLGIGTEIERDAEQRTLGVKLRLLNASDKPLAIVDLPGGRTFSLEQDVSWGWESGWRWVNGDAAHKEVEDSDVRVLEPGEIHTVHIRLSDPVWFVSKDNQPARPITGLQSHLRFRFVYRPPSKEECAHLEKADLIWHGYLPSRAFTGRGWVD